MQNTQASDPDEEKQSGKISQARDDLSKIQNIRRSKIKHELKHEVTQQVWDIRTMR